MIDASGSWGVLRIFVDPHELKASKKPKMTIAIENVFFIIIVVVQLSVSPIRAVRLRVCFCFTCKNTLFSIKPLSLQKFQTL